MNWKMCKQTIMGWFAHFNICQKHSITKTGSKHSIYVPKFHKSAKFQNIIYHNKKQVMESKNVMLVSSMGITACLEESIQ